MTSRVRNYIIAYSFVIAFIASILNIRVVNKLSDADETEKEAKKYMRFVLPAIAMISFFFGCYYIALVIAGGESAGKDKFAGIIYMFIIGGILIIMNATILSGNNLIDLIKFGPLISKRPIKRVFNNLTLPLISFPIRSMQT